MKRTGTEPVQSCLKTPNHNNVKCCVLSKIFYTFLERLGYNLWVVLRDADLIWGSPKKKNIYIYIYINSYPGKHKQQGKHFAVIKKNYLGRNKTEKTKTEKRKKSENQKRKKQEKHNNKAHKVVPAKAVQTRAKVGQNGQPDGQDSWSVSCGNPRSVFPPLPASFLPFLPSVLVCVSVSLSPFSSGCDFLVLTLN